MAGLPDITPYSLPRADQLPPSIPTWRPDPGRCVLLIHDMQSYFLRPFPPVLLKQLLGNVVALRERCAALGVPVAYSAQPGGMTRRQRGLLADFWSAGMGTDPADRQVVPELSPGPRDLVLTKWRYSAFFRTCLLDLFRDTGRDQLIICGVYANIGVLTTAVESFSNDLETFLAADGIADFTVEAHRGALRYAAASCAVVSTTGALLAGLDATTGAGADRMVMA